VPAAGPARRRRGRASPRDTRCSADPTVARATGPPTLTARSLRRVHGSRAARPGACCPGGPPTRQVAASAARAGAARRVRRPAAGTRGSAFSPVGAGPSPRTGRARERAGGKSG
jgi:hypothetical protein